MEGGERQRKWQRIAVMVLFCFLALGLTYFSWQGLIKVLTIGKSSEVNDDAFNGKELEADVGPSLAFMEKGLNDALIQPLKDANEDDLVKEAPWSSSNSSLHCGLNKMMFKVMGPGASELQLDIGSGEPIPLNQVPDSCGILVNQTMLGVVLLVPYDACAVIQENGTYVLMMSWRDSAVNVTCTMLPNAGVNATLPVALPKAQLPHKSLSLYRMKRYSRQRPMYVPCTPFRRYPLCLLTTPLPTLTPTTTTPTTTDAPRKPVYHNPYFWKKLLAFYSLYDHYVKSHPQNILQNYYHAYKYPGWPVQLQANQMPEIINHPIYQILSGYLSPTQTPALEMPTASCPHAKPSPLDLLFGQRGSLGNPESQGEQPNASPQIRAAPESPANPDSFWQSFPLLYPSGSQNDPHFGWEDLTPKYK